MPSHTPSERRKRVFSETFNNPPSTVDESKTKGAQRKQKIAIALSKVRRGK